MHVPQSIHEAEHKAGLLSIDFKGILQMSQNKEQALVMSPQYRDVSILGGVVRVRIRPTASGFLQGLMKGR